MDRTLTITVDGDVKGNLLRTLRRGFAASGYVGETLNFATPALFLGKLTENRWQMMQAMQAAGEVGVRELARRLGRGLHRVHDDAQALVEIGLLEKTPAGKLVCPFAEIRVDFRLLNARRLAA
jgi:predicted transcriptional regulator